MHLDFTQFSNGIRLIKPNGHLDIAGVSAVETQFLAHCGGDQPRVIVDLSGVGFMASLGIRLLLQAIKKITAHGGRLVLLNPTKAVDSALEISGLGHFIQRGSEAEAATALLQPGN